jgi:putative phosphoesterase
MGNYDEGVGYEKGDCGCAYLSNEESENGQISIDWTTEQVTPDNKEFLRSLKKDIRFEIDDKKFLLVHGSPRRINEYLYEDRPEDSFRRVIEGQEIDLLICGHTHKPYHKVIDSVHIINDGSVGKPKDGDPKACYAMVDTETWEVVFRKVEYKVDVVAEEIINKGLPEAYAKALLSGGK